MTNNKPRQIDAEQFGPFAYNGISPADMFESRFRMKLPDNMRSEIFYAFQAASAETAKALRPEDIWAVFKNAYITPKEAAVFYVTHDTHTFGDGSKFVSISVIENDEIKIKGGDGLTCAEAVVDAFHMAGHTIIRERGMIDAPDYGRKPCVIVGIARDDGNVHFGVGISEQHQTAEVMAATRACGRALYAAKSQKEGIHP